ncbi:MAG: PEP-CTERM sorting domain-containing protein, partial [bacterium]|nr:PEP-CTERM sorting domain-containing protein [bacterium]
NAGASNQGQAVGTSGWYYNNVRNNGAVGIRTNYPWNGNGSVYFNTPTGAAKADIEYLVNAVSIGGNFFSAGVIAPFSQLQSLSYRWYRDSSSTNPAVQHPAVRILLDLDGNPLTPLDRAGLVFERAYNSLPTLTNQWVNDTVTLSTNLWSFGALGFATDLDGNSYPYDETWSEWLSYFSTNHPNAAIVGFSMGVGSGWVGDFKGAVDGISWTINGQTSSYNFETFRVQVIPEPTTMALFGLGLAAVGRLVRRKRA